MYIKPKNLKALELRREGFSKKESERGYAIVDYNGTGMLEIQSISVDLNDDAECAEQAVKDGIALIPIEELPENFSRKYLGWIDTPVNRWRIKEYAEKEASGKVL